MFRGYFMSYDVDNSLIDMMVDDLYENSGKHDYDTTSSATGKEYQRVYYENLYKVTEAVYKTISRSGFGRCYMVFHG